MKNFVFIVSTLLESNVDKIISRLESRGIDWYRFNTETFPLACRISLYDLSSGETYAVISDGERQIDTRQITSIWHRRMGDSVLPAGLVGYEKNFVRNESWALLQGMYTSIKCFGVNPRDKETKANLKAYQLQVAKQVGFRTPNTLVTNAPDDVRSFVENTSGPILFKPVAGAAAAGKRPELSKEMQQAYPKGFAVPPAAPEDDFYTRTYTVFSQILTPERLAKIDHIVSCPVVFQEYIQKQVELRITIVGERIFAAEIHSQDFEETKIDFRHLAISPTTMPRHEVHHLPDEISEKLLRLMQELGLVFGCLDLILTPEGEYVFLEINPAGQWGWIEHFTKMPITEALTDMLIRGSATG